MRKRKRERESECHIAPFLSLLQREEKGALVRNLLLLPPFSVSFLRGEFSKSSLAAPKGKKKKKGEKGLGSYFPSIF